MASMSTNEVQSNPVSGIRRKPVASREYQQVAAQDEDESQAAETRSMSRNMMEERNTLLSDSTEVDFEVLHPVSPLVSDDGGRLETEPSSSDLSKHSNIRWTSASTPQMWNSIWLQKMILVGFAAGFLSMLLTTALLFHFSVRNQGLGPQKEVNHYAWKYGPTAVLVVTAALWRQVDHASKTLLPWQELRRGPTSAQKSILLDYVSPLVTTSFSNAIKNRHWAVVITTLGWLFLVLTTAFSTGLIILEPTSVTRDGAQIEVKGQFNADGFQLDNVTSTPAELYYGIRFQNLQYPPGTFQDRVVPELQPPPDSPAQVNYSAITPGLDVNFDCEVLPIQNATVVYLPWFSILGSFWAINITTPDCDITNALIAAGPDHNIYHQENATQNYQGIFQDYTCNLGVDYSLPSSEWNSTTTDRIYSGSEDHRILLSVSDLRFSPWNPWGNSPDYIYMNNLTVALCKFNYSMNQYDVTSSSRSESLSQAELVKSSDSQSPLVPGFQTGQLGMSIVSSTNQMALGQGGVDYVLSEQVPTFFQFLSLMNGNTSIGAFMDPELLIRYSTEAFKGIGVQALHQFTVKADNRTVPGLITYTEDRLHVKGLSTGLMCAFFGALTILSIALVFLRPTNVISREPGSITAIATILAASPELQRCLVGLGSTRRSFIRQKLSKLTFHSKVTPGAESTFSVEPTRPQDEQQDFQDPRAEATALNWWYPAAGKPWFLILAVIIPLVLVGALEGVQRLSDRNAGFVNVGPTSSIVLATYVPAAVAICIAGMYSSLEFMVTLFVPFATLKRGNASASRSVSLNLVGKFAPHAMFLSLRSRYFGVSVILLSTFIGSLLTVVVSGLYSVVSIPNVESVTLQQSDSFNPDQGDLSLSDNQAGAITRLIQSVRLPYPKWTYGDMAFNTIQQPSMTSDNTSAVNIPLSVKLAATRASLNCSVVPTESRLMRRVGDDFLDSGEGMAQFPGENGFYLPYENKMFVAVNTTLPWNCDQLEQKNVTRSPWTQYYHLPNNSAPAYIGKASLMMWSSDLIFGDGAVDTDITTGTGFGEGGLTTTGYGCPSLSVTLGTARLASSQKKKNSTTYTFEADLATILCYQNMEQVMTNVTFDLPSLSISTSAPPIPDEATSQQLRTSKTSSLNFEFPINSFLLALNKGRPNSTIPSPNDGDGYNNDIDAFITSLVTGENGRPMEQLAGENNTQNLIESSNTLYKAYMAQAISQNMRSDTAPTGAFLPTYEGQIISPGRLRLQQNRTPKLVLQAMLATMTVCAIVARLLVRVKDVLPHDPCSIAGTATVLAGSQLCTREVIPEGSEWRSDGELKRAGVLEGWLFKLGWWGEERGRFGIDVQGRKEG